MKCETHIQGWELLQRHRDKLSLIVFSTKHPIMITNILQFKSTFRCWHTWVMYSRMKTKTWISTLSFFLIDWVKYTVVCIISREISCYLWQVVWVIVPLQTEMKEKMPDTKFPHIVCLGEIWITKLDDGIGSPQIVII